MIRASTIALFLLLCSCQIALLDQPDKNLKPVKVNIGWNQPGPLDHVASWKLSWGFASGDYTNAVYTATTNAVATVYPGKTYYFFVKVVSDLVDTNGETIVVDCDKELAYTVPSKQGPK